MITCEQGKWTKRCDVCKEIMSQIPQTTSRLSDEPEDTKQALGIEFNHTAVCVEHTFNEITGEWE